MTPAQTIIVRKQSIINIELYNAMLSCFVEESEHSGYKHFPSPSNCPKLIFIKDPETENNTDMPVGESADTKYAGVTFDFSSAQDPSEKTLVYPTHDKFTIGMINQTPPTLFAHGDDYANTKELDMMDVLPFTFLYGLGGPKMKGHTQISLKTCIQRYYITVMPKFERGDTVQGVCHIHVRQLSYASGVMMARSNGNGKPLAERLTELTVKDIKSASESNNRRLSENIRLPTQPYRANYHKKGRSN